MFSAASPAFAGIVALLNGARLAEGRKPLGFLNPFVSYMVLPTGFNLLIALADLPVRLPRPDRYCGWWFEGLHRKGYLLGPTLTGCARCRMERNPGMGSCHWLWHTQLPSAIGLVADIECAVLCIEHCSHLCGILVSPSINLLRSNFLQLMTREHLVQSPGTVKRRRCNSIDAQSN